VNVKRGGISIVNKKDGKIVARREVDRKFNKERNDKLKEAKSMAQDSLLGLRANILLYFLRGGKVKTSQSELAGDAEIKAAKKAGFISDSGRSIDMIALEDLPELGGIVSDEQDAINEVLDVLASFENKAQMEDELVEMRDKLTNDMDEAARYEYEAQMNRALDNGELNEDELVEYYESLSEDDKVKSIEDYEKFYREIEREQLDQEGEGTRGAYPSEGTTQEAQEQKITYGPNEGLTQTDTAAGPFVSESGNTPYSERGGVRGQAVREGGVGNTVKAVWNKYKQIKFNGSVKVKYAEDVAHIMRKLEDKSVEHAFAVHVDKNGKAHIQFLGMGGPTSTIVDPRLVLAGVKKFKSKKVYLVHNHPSGSLVASRADMQLTNRVDNVLRPLDIELEHVIMDTYKKQYVHLFPDDISFVQSRDITKENIEEYNKALKVEIMDEQKILSEPVASIKSSMDVSQFLMQVRFTALPKHGMLLLNNKNEIIGNYIFKKGFDYNEATSFIAEAGVGTGIIFYSNQNQFESGIKPMVKSLESADVKVFDYVIVNSDSEGVKGYYESYADSGKLSETQAEYGTNSIPNELREPAPRSNAEIQQLMEDSMDAVDNAIESGKDAQSAVNDLIGDKDWYFGLTAKQKTQFDEILQDEFGVIPTIEQKVEAKAAPTGVGEDIRSIVDNYYKLKDGDRSAKDAINEILDADPKLKYIYDNIRKINKQLQEAGVITDKTDGCP
jgi:DNA repair protein RadC